MGGLWDMFFGSGAKMHGTLDKNQREMQNRFMQGLENDPLYGAGSDFLMNLLSGDPSAFADFEAPFQQQFQQQTVPKLAQQFAGMGTGAGAVGSSGFNNSMAQAGRDLTTQLAGLRSGLQMQASQQGLQYANQPFQNYLQGMNVQTKGMSQGYPGALQMALAAWIASGGKGGGGAPGGGG